MAGLYQTPMESIDPARLAKGDLSVMKHRFFALLFSILSLSSNCSLFDRPVWSPDGSGQTASFISVWKTDNTADGQLNADQIILPLTSTGTYDFSIDWGDGVSERVTSFAGRMHTYDSPGEYTLTMSGTINGFAFNSNAERNKIIEIKQWGCLSLGNEGSYFKGCENLKITAFDILDMSQTNNLAFAFYNCPALTTVPSMDLWDVSNVLKMNYMFGCSPSFNQDLNSWRISSARDMSYMFFQATSFNGNISSWNVSSVFNMSGMFFGARKFNGDIGSWDVSSVTRMALMFGNAISFNGNIGSWNVSNVIAMDNMFFNASNFDQNLGAWNILKASNMTDMFHMGALSTANYDALLNGWASRSVQPNIVFSGGNSKYSNNSASARAALSNAGGNNWTIFDGGPLP
jgi:surface protein